jgi:hypothetical protein
MDLVGKLFLPAAGRLSLPAVPASAVATPADGLCSELFTPGLPISSARYQLRIVRSVSFLRSTRRPWFPARIEHHGGAQKGGDAAMATTLTSVCFAPVRRA